MATLIFVEDRSQIPNVVSKSKSEFMDDFATPFQPQEEGFLFPQDKQRKNTIFAPTKKTTL